MENLKTIALKFTGYEQEPSNEGYKGRKIIKEEATGSIASRTRIESEQDN